MTIRIAMVFFVVSFAAITGWLVTREPAENGIDQADASLNSKTAGSKPPGKPTTGIGNTNSPDNVTAISESEKKLKLALFSTVIPSIDFKELPLIEALALLNLEIKELESQPASNLNIVIYQNNPASHSSEDYQTTDSPAITLKANEISIADAISQICEQTGHRWRVEGQKVVLHPVE